MSHKSPSCTFWSDPSMRTKPGAHYVVMKCEADLFTPRRDNGLICLQLKGPQIENNPDSIIRRAGGVLSQPPMDAPHCKHWVCTTHAQRWTSGERCGFYLLFTVWFHRILMLSDRLFVGVWGCSFPLLQRGIFWSPWSLTEANQHRVIDLSISNRLSSKISSSGSVAFCPAASILNILAQLERQEPTVCSLSFSFSFGKGTRNSSQISNTYPGVMSHNCRFRSAGSCH